MSELSGKLIQGFSTSFSGGPGKLVLGFSISLCVSKVTSVVLTGEFSGDGGMKVSGIGVEAGGGGRIVVGQQTAGIVGKSGIGGLLRTDWMLMSVVWQVIVCEQGAGGLLTTESMLVSIFWQSGAWVQTVLDFSSLGHEFNSDKGFRILIKCLLAGGGACEMDGFVELVLSVSVEEWVETELQSILPVLSDETLWFGLDDEGQGLELLILVSLCCFPVRT